MIITDLSQFAVQRNRKSSKWIRQYKGIDINISDKAVDIRCDNPSCATPGGRVWRAHLQDFFDKPYHECRSCRIAADKNPRAMTGKVTWNKNLTKETDARIKEQGERHSEIMRGKNNPWFGKFGSAHPNFGKSINAGKSNPQYKDGKSYDRWSKRHNLTQRKWAKQVKDRDDYICFACKKRGGRLVSHHLFDYATHPDKRLDIDNGVCLCTKCHTSFHLWNGGQVKPCTPNQFYKWVKQLKTLR